MHADGREGILHHLAPMLPIPTDAVDAGGPPPGVRAVLFDVYGTLLISGTGDIGVAAGQHGAFGLTGLLRSLGYGRNPEMAAAQIPVLLERFITERHTELRAEGVDCPEVEIRDVWKKALAVLRNEGLIDDPDHDPNDARFIEFLAIGYELEVNPVWSMPGFPEVVEALSNANLRLGIVSNAQFYTPPILESLAGKSLAEMGFEEGLCAWSYRLSRAKPSPKVFSGPLERLSEDGIAPEEVLYVGNDMLNDVYAASEAGCRTCLFAGDKRSLKLRESDKRASMTPDMTITRLSRLESLIVTGASDGD